MVAWFIVAIGTIGLFAYVAVVGVQTTTTAADATSRAEIVRRTDAAVAAIVQRVASGSDGSLYLPVGRVTNAGFYGLPVDMTEQGSTSFGLDMVYCPFGGGSSSTTGTQDVRMPSGSTYAVSTLALQDKQYVVAGRPAYTGVAANPNLMGFVISPLLRGSNPVGCDQITAAGTGFTAPNAIVRPILRDVMAEPARVDRGGGNAYYVSTQGGGNGTSPSSPGTLNNALAFWRSRQIADFHIYLAEGSYTIAPNTMTTTLAGYVEHPAGSKLALHGAGADRVRIAFSSASRVLLDSDLVLDRVTMASEVVADGKHRVLLNQAATGKLTATNGSEIAVTGSATVSDADGNANVIDIVGSSELNIASATLNVNYSPAQTGINVTRGSKLSSLFSTLVFTPSSGVGHSTDIVVGEGSTASLRNGTMTFNGRADFSIYNLGTVNFGEMVLNYQSGGTTAMYLDYGSDTTLQQVTIGGSNLINSGIVERGAYRVRGSTVVINSRLAGSCWRDADANSRLFAYASSGITNNDNGSGVGADEPVPAMTAAPTADQVRAHQLAQTRNTERQQLRALNGSRWSCRRF